MPLLQALAGPELEALAQALKAVEFEPGEPVVRQGDPGDAMYFIEAGAATAEIDGKVVRDYSSGDYFGELALMSNQPRSASVIARGSAKLRLLALPQVCTPHGAAASAAQIAARSPRRSLADRWAAVFAVFCAIIAAGLRVAGARAWRHQIPPRHTGAPQRPALCLPLLPLFRPSSRQLFGTGRPRNTRSSGPVMPSRAKTLGR